MGILNKTKVYTIGSMEYGNGEDWRNELKTHFKPRGIHVLDPYHKQFVLACDETEEKREELKAWREQGKYEELAAYCKNFRRLDLNCVDKSDFIVWNLDVTVPTIGSVEEFSVGVKLKRPAYIICKQGKTKCPLWIFGMIPHQYIMSSLEEFVVEIKQIDDGTKPMDNRWRLFQEEIR